jgi:hypothetical protein
MENDQRVNITRTADYLIIPTNLSIEEIRDFQHTPRILKKAIGLYENLEVSLNEALMTEPYLMPVFVLADGMMEQSKGDWSIKLDYGVELKVGSDIRIDLYGLESYYYEAREGDDGEKWVLAGVATIQNANVPDLRVVLGRSCGVIFRDKKLEGLIQGQKIQDAKSKKKEVLEAYGKVIGEDGHDWIPLLEKFLEKSGL